MHGYVPKVLGPTELVRALQMIIAGQIYVPPVLAHGAAADPATLPAAGSGDPGRDALARLTQRQRDVLHELISGRSNKEIARHLGLGEGTVKIHVAALLRALQLPNRAAAAAFGAGLASRV